MSFLYVIKEGDSDDGGLVAAVALRWGELPGGPAWLWSGHASPQDLSPRVREGGEAPGEQSRWNSYLPVCPVQRQSPPGHSTDRPQRPRRKGTPLRTGRHMYFETLTQQIQNHRKWGNRARLGSLPMSLLCLSSFASRII